VAFAHFFGAQFFATDGLTGHCVTLTKFPGQDLEQTMRIVKHGIDCTGFASMPETEGESAS
jgi:hypothetical protein